MSSVTLEKVDPTASRYLPEVLLEESGTDGNGADRNGDVTLLTDDWRNVSRVLERSFSSPLYPRGLAARIDELDWIIDNDLVSSLFAVIASAHDEDVDEEGHLHGAQTHAVLRRVFYARLGWLDHILTSSEYLLGDTFTDADAHLFGVLLTFDIGYRPAFPTPDALISDYPHLWEYARRIYHQSELVTEQDKIDLGLLTDSDGELRSQWRLTIDGEFFDTLRRGWNR